jgi:hypothetical protein
MIGGVTITVTIPYHTIPYLLRRGNFLTRFLSLIFRSTILTRCFYIQNSQVYLPTYYKSPSKFFAVKVTKIAPTPLPPCLNLINPPIARKLKVTFVQKTLSRRKITVYHCVDRIRHGSHEKGGGGREGSLVYGRSPPSRTMMARKKKKKRKKEREH